jgi:hypothetical protein
VKGKLDDILTGIGVRRRKTDEEPLVDDIPRTTLDEIETSHLAGLKGTGVAKSNTTRKDLVHALSHSG